jgi:hypothetical protein
MAVAQEVLPPPNPVDTEHSPDLKIDDTRTPNTMTDPSRPATAGVVWTDDLQANTI